MKDTSNVVIIGYATAAAPGISWVRRVAGHWWREQPDPRPLLSISTTPLREPHPERLHELIASARPITGREAPLTSSAWDAVPRHRHQVFVCRGPRCSARGAELIASALSAELDRQGLGDDDVLLTQTGCQFPCNHAPVVTVQPDDVWYGAVQPDDIASLVTEHLMEGRPLGRRRLPRA